MCQMHPQCCTEGTEECGEQQCILRRPPFSFDGLPLIAEEHEHRNQVQQGVYDDGDVDGVHPITMM